MDYLIGIKWFSKNKSRKSMILMEFESKYNTFIPFKNYIQCWILKGLFSIILHLKKLVTNWLWCHWWIIHKEHVLKSGLRSKYGIKDFRRETMGEMRENSIFTLLYTWTRLFQILYQGGVKPWIVNTLIWIHQFASKPHIMNTYLVLLIKANNSSVSDF